MYFRALAPRRLEAQPDLNPLHRGDRHQRLGEAAVELRVPRDVRAESHREAEAHDLDDATERVTGGLSDVDAADHLGLGLGIQAADGALVSDCV